MAWSDHKLALVGDHSHLLCTTCIIPLAHTHTHTHAHTHTHRYMFGSSVSRSLALPIHVCTLRQPQRPAVRHNGVCLVCIGHVSAVLLEGLDRWNVQYDMQRGCLIMRTRHRVAAPRSAIKRSFSFYFFCYTPALIIPSVSAFSNDQEVPWSSP
jgi:hypothetical protein